MPPAYIRVALHDLGMQVWHEENERQDGESDTARHGNSSDIPCWLLVEAKLGGALVDD